jgi:hypothetical protein
MKLGLSGLSKRPSESNESPSVSEVLAYLRVQILLNDLVREEIFITKVVSLEVAIFNE